MVPPLLLAAFMNPDLKIISFSSNYLRGSSANTYAELSNLMPEKICELNLNYSVPTMDLAEVWLSDIQNQQNLQILDLQGCPLG